VRNAPSGAYASITVVLVLQHGRRSKMVKLPKAVLRNNEVRILYKGVRYTEQAFASIFPGLYAKTFLSTMPEALPAISTQEAMACV
jgi:hypothetical protein